MAYLMHGNSPHDGRSPPETPEMTPEQRRAFRRALASLTATTRELLPDEFVVGAEIIERPEGPRATVAVQPPAGGVVSAGFAPDEEPSEDLARELAAGAALEVKRASGQFSQTAR